MTTKILALGPIPMSVKYESTRTFESRTNPGVFITLRKMSERRRADLYSMTAESRMEERKLIERGREILDRKVAVLKEDGSKKIDEATGEVVTDFQNEVDRGALVDWVSDLREFQKTKVYGIMIRWGVSKIEGLEIDGVPATLESLLLDGPEDLADEIYEEIQGRAELSGEERKNSSSPTISSEQDGTATTPTAAIPAAMADMPQDETASATSPKT